MMQYSQRFKLLTLFCSITLVIWLGFAYVEHQYDFDHHHHSEHHCQQFSSVQHGLANHTPAPVLLPITQRESVLDDYPAVRKAASVYKARSPPTS